MSRGPSWGRSISRPLTLRLTLPFLRGDDDHGLPAVPSDHLRSLLQGALNNFTQRVSEKPTSSPSPGGSLSGFIGIRTHGREIGDRAQVRGHRGASRSDRARERGHCASERCHQASERSGSTRELSHCSACAVIAFGEGMIELANAVAQLANAVTELANAVIAFADGMIARA